MNMLAHAADGFAANSAHRDFKAPQMSDPCADLSPREAQIAELTAMGLSNKEIARRLEISHHTVSTHLRRVFDKLGVNRRARLAAVLSGRSPRTAGRA